MDVRGSRALRSLIAGAAAAVGLLLAPAPAAAASVSYEVGDQALVHVFTRNAVVTVRTWDRNTVQIEWPDGEPIVPWKGAQQIVQTNFPIRALTVKEDLGGGLSSTATIPPEDFPVSGLALGLHDSVHVEEAAPPADVVRPPAEEAHVTIMIPASIRILDVRMNRGRLNLSDFHGTSFTSVNGGTVTFNRVGGDAFVQVLSGLFYAENSSFDRLRARTNRADLIFDGCATRQVEASTLTGRIVYDKGVFYPGVARFESDRGMIALGVEGGAQLAAHSDEGRVYTSFLGRAQIANPGPSDASVTAAAGGPVVNAASIHGNVFVYDGSIAERRVITADFRPVLSALVNRRRFVQASALPRGAGPALFGPARPVRPAVDARPRMRRARIRARISASWRRRV